jgi:hypothetical protein
VLSILLSETTEMGYAGVVSDSGDRLLVGIGSLQLPMYFPHPYLPQ